jgi:hypothetical protein
VKVVARTPAPASLPTNKPHGLTKNVSNSPSYRVCRQKGIAGADLVERSSNTAARQASARVKRSSRNKIAARALTGFSVFLDPVKVA